MAWYVLRYGDVPSDVTEFAIPEHVNVIGCGAFCGCRNLTSLTIPNSVIQIWLYAFSGCSNLASITIPASVRRIEEGTFDGCEKLTIHTPNGSYAESWAKEHKIPVETY